MNKLILSTQHLILLCLTAMLFVACGGDSNKNEVTTNGESFSLNKGFLESYGENGNGSFDWDVTLTSSDVTYDQSQAEFEGNGTVVYLDLNTNSATGLVDGTYNYDPVRDAFTMVAGSIGFDFELNSQTGVGFSITAGSVTITGEKIDFDVTLSNGNNAVGNYTGALTSI